MINPFKQIKKILGIIVIPLVLFSCGSPSNPPKQSEGHITKEKTPDANILSRSEIPQIVKSTPYVPLPKPHKKPETYTVVVNEVPVSELLFAIARDADIDIDIVGPIEGTVTLNAIDKTLVQILERIALHTDIKFDLKGNHLIIENDAEYLKTYHVDYVNISRSSESRIELATQISATGTGSEENSSGIGNNSFTTVTNRSENNFWRSIEINISQIIGQVGESDPSSGATSEERNNASSEEDANTENLTGSQSSVIINSETGLVTVVTTDRKHRKIAAYLDLLMSKARQQVLIEATIVEVELSNEYESGVDWSVISTTGSGLSLTQSFTGNNLTNAPFFSAQFTDPLNALGNVTATVKALEKFGDVQVLSSPKIIAMNNQTALLKVVDNRVYFTTSIEVQPATSSTPRIETYETTLHTVPIGFVMNVTPNISETEEILLNVRPTISRILGVVEDPNPALRTAGVVSNIPEIQVREMESLLRMNSGQVAIIGGLMQDKIDKSSSGLPGANEIPFLNNLLSYKEDKITKTELLVFIKATLVNAASVDNELKDYYKYVPEKNRSHLSPNER